MPGTGMEEFGTRVIHRLKGSPSENTKYTQQVFNLSTYGIMSSQSTFEGRENTPLTAATLCVVASVFDVMNNAGMLGLSVCYVMSQPFLCSSLVKSKPTRLSREELKFEASKQNKQNKKTKTKTCYINI